MSLSKDKNWWRQAAIYQIYPRSFKDSNGDGIGDIKGITSQIDYLSSLSLDAVWLSPFFPSALADGGYDVDDYRNVDPKLGSLADFDEMLAELHKVGQIQFHRTAGAHQAAGVTGHVERDALAGAGDHLEVFFSTGEVDHLGVGIQVGLDAADQVDVDRQIARGQRHAGHAHKGHRAGLRLERRPLQACAAVGAWRRIGQHQGKVHPAHGQAH